MVIHTWDDSSQTYISIGGFRSGTKVNPLPSFKSKKIVWEHKTELCFDDAKILAFFWLLTP